MISEKAGASDSFDINADGNCYELNAVYQPIETFTYYKDGTIFDGALSKKGDIFIKFRITDVQTILQHTSKTYVPLKAVLSDTGSFNLLKYATASPQCVLNGYSYPSKETVLSSTVTPALFSENKDSLAFSNAIQFSPTGNYIYGGVVYHFDFSNVSNFNSEIYSNRSKASFKFTLEARE